MEDSMEDPMMSMSAEQLRAEIEAAGREADAEDARHQDLRDETEQARERYRLRQDLYDVRTWLEAARERNDHESAVRQAIDVILPGNASQSGRRPRKPAVMQASGGESTNFGQKVAKGEYVWRIEGLSWMSCVLEMAGQDFASSQFELDDQIFYFRYSPWAHRVCNQKPLRGSLAIIVLTGDAHALFALRYGIFVKARNGDYVRWGERRDIVHRGLVSAYGPDVHWPEHPPVSLGIFGLSHEELLQSEWVENDTLTVKFELEVCPPGCATRQHLHLAEVPEPTLHKDTEVLLKEGTCSDVRFMVQDEVIHAHSQVLCARSEVFSKQLMAGMQESISKVIVIEDCEVVTFKAFLQFLYTDELPDAQNLCPQGASNARMRAAAPSSRGFWHS